MDIFTGNEKDIFEAGKNLVEIMGPAVKGFLNRIKQKRGAYLEKGGLEEAINEYLERCFRQNYFMNTIVFRGQQKSVFDLYVPLTIIRKTKIEEEKRAYVVDENAIEIVENNDKLMLIDTAGMGKSTIVKYMTLQSILRYDKIPIIVELRNYDVNLSMENYILTRLNNEGKERIGVGNLRHLLENGGAIIFFDGFDEVAEDKKGKVIDAIKDFIAKTSNCKMILTSREERNLIAFGEFLEYKIRGLTLDEAFTLIRKYDATGGELADELIHSINTSKNMGILRPLLTNPLLVSLLYKAYEYKKDINEYKKHIFYRQVYNALFEDHDISKGGAYKHIKKSGLDSEDFRKTLNRLGYIMIKADRFEYEEDDFKKVAQDALKAIPEKKVDVIGYLDDLINAIPFFVKEGMTYRWVHKSFCEYFAASFICEDTKEKEDGLLMNMYQSNSVDKYINVLDFCYDMDTLAFRRTIIYDFAKKYIDYCNKCFSDGHFGQFAQPYIQMLRSNLFLCEIYLEYDEQNRNNVEFLFEIWENGDDENLEPFWVENLDTTNYKVCFVDKGLVPIHLLLKRKGVDLWSKIGIKKRFIKKSTAEKLNEFKLEKYAYNDDKNNVFNQKGVLESMARATARLNERDIVLDCKKCKEILEQIECEKEEKKDDDFFSLP